MCMCVCGGRGGGGGGGGWEKREKAGGRERKRKREKQVLEMEMFVAALVTFIIFQTQDRKQRNLLNYRPAPFTMSEKEQVTLAEGHDQDQYGEIDAESLNLQRSLESLSSWESQMSKVEKDAEIYRIKQSQPMYAKRREILKQVLKFWYIILAENDEFGDYASPEDLKYLEYIDDIYVYYPISSESLGKEGDVNNELNNKDFEITIGFTENDLIPKQSITKKFRTYVGEDGEDHVKSEPVDIQWPKGMDKINPQIIKQKSNGNSMTSEEKKNYRAGMKSFFAWFAWTGEKPGKEFRNGEDLTNLITEDIFVNALKYYIVALSNDSEDGEDDEEDSTEGEELDLSEEEEQEEEEEEDEEEGQQDRAEARLSSSKGLKRLSDDNANEETQNKKQK